MAKVPWEITREMFLDEQEIHGLLRHVDGAVRGRRGMQRLLAELDRVIVESLLFSGLRSSEFCSLTLGDTVLGTGLPAFEVRPLRGEGRRVFLPRSLVELIERFVAEVRPRFVPEGVDPGDLEQPFVFNEHRRPYERTGLYRRVVRVLSEAGLEGRASVQLLRHTYGYLAYAGSGGNLLFVQRQLGHAHPMITSVYAQFVHESYEAIADDVGAVLAPRARRLKRKGARKCKRTTR